MELKRQDPIIDSTNPFSDDCLNRKGLASALTNLVKEAQGPLVVALNGGWGTGKTFFLQRWIAEFEAVRVDDSRPDFSGVINYNAWEDDDLDDPFLSLVGQLHRHLHSKVDLLNDAQLKGSWERRVREFGESAARVLGICATHLSRVAAHHTGFDPAELVRSLANYQAARVEAYAESIQARVDFKSRLQAVAAEVKSLSGLPLVFVIDDLDRCRPAFAVSLLEKVKHLFDVQNVVFVLGIDVVQFSTSLRGIYGSDFDAPNYLYRLIDFELKLPPASPEHYIARLLEDHGVAHFLYGRLNKGAEAVQGVIQELQDVIVYLGCRYDLTLRQIERVIRDVVGVERLRPVGSPVDAALLALIVVLRLCDGPYYARVVAGQIAPKELLDRIFLEGEIPRPSMPRAEWHLAVVVYAALRGSAHGADIDKLFFSRDAELLQVGGEFFPRILEGQIVLVRNIFEKARALNLSYLSVVQLARSLDYLEP